MSEQLTTGSCLCGKVNFTITGEPLRMAQCHCIGCQKASGTGHMSLAFFKDEQISIEGELSSHAAEADSGNINTRSFCPGCGARLFGSNSARPGLMAVTAGSVEDSSWFKPQAVVYTKDQPAWDESAQDVPRFEAMPPPA